MTSSGPTMRDSVLGAIGRRMATDRSIYFLTADLGAPALDGLRAAHPARCFNVGIAEQNLIAVATGLALEGCTVYAYGIAAFVSMRAFEQLRTHLSQLAQMRSLNVNVIGLGAGFSYDVSGPSHQCLEDVSLVRLLPNIELFSPSDGFLAGAYVERTLRERRPKYLRLDGKPLPSLYARPEEIDFDRGFSVLCEGGDTCLVTTGYGTQQGARISGRLREEGIAVGHVDLYVLTNFDEDALVRTLYRYRRVVTLGEMFLRRGGLDSLVADLVNDRCPGVELKRYGPDGPFLFEFQGREALQRAYGMDDDTVVGNLRALLGPAV